MELTVEQLKLIFDGNREDSYPSIISELSDKTVEEVACFLATISIESNKLKNIEENLNYSRSGLLRTFKKYFDESNVDAFVKKPVLIANKVYGGRMGNVGSNDGYKYRGRGFIQLTGRNNYYLYGSLLGCDLLNNPDLLMDNSLIMTRTAIVFFDCNNIWKYAREGDIDNVSSLVNVGSIGKADRVNHLNERRNEYKRIKEILV